MKLCIPARCLVDNPGEKLEPVSPVPRPGSSPPRFRGQSGKAHICDCEHQNLATAVRTRVDSHHRCFKRHTNRLRWPADRLSASSVEMARAQARPILFPLSLAPRFDQTLFSTRIKDFRGDERLTSDQDRPHWYGEEQETTICREREGR